MTIELQDGLVFEDATSRAIFNHYSFCERVKHIMGKYAKIDYELATEKMNASRLVRIPLSINQLLVLTHELEFHWAMLLAHGHMYWQRGIPSDFNGFREEYLAWEEEMAQKYDLKESYDYFDKIKI